MVVREGLWGGPQGPGGQGEGVGRGSGNRLPKDFGVAPPNVAQSP